MRHVFICIGILFLFLLICVIVGKIWTCIAVKKVKKTCQEKKVCRLNQVIRPFGFLYDPEQDIFYSRLHPWQRALGYEKDYDEGAMLLSMVIHCEPVYFEYRGKLWLIECWKGQYGMTTGGEIGIYNAEKPPNFKEGDEKNLHYDSVSDEELIGMQFILRLNDNPLLSRCNRHWWLTGFDLGVFAALSRLSMCVQLTFPSDEMCFAYYKGLLRAGYKAEEISLCRRKIQFLFDRPKTSQPVKKCRLLRCLAQWNNRRNCKIYGKRTKMFEKDLDKITFLCYRYPLLYRAIFRFNRLKPFKKVRKKRRRKSAANK